MRPNSARASLAGLAAVMAAAVPAGPAAAQAIYRCDDGRGGVLYADSPCAGGTAVDLLPGKADPAAIERLRREQRAFDERQAARDAKARAEAEAARERLAAQRARQPVAEPPPNGAWFDGFNWGFNWPWYSVPAVPPPPPPRPQPPAPAPYVPATPSPGFPASSPGMAGPRG